MNRISGTRRLCFFLGAICYATGFANPALTPGVWKNISPPTVDLSSAHFGDPEVDLDPSNPATLYLCVDMQGIWRSTDGGSTWAIVGDPTTAATYNYGPTAKYLDSPIKVAVDPNNANHLYATQGVRGKTEGFWVSTDGGVNWALPPGFVTATATIGTRDMTQFAVDPSNFNHVLVGSHSAWTGMGNAGVLETTDGGATFAIHQPVSSWGSGSMGINFLYDPDLGIGNNQTWLVSTDGNGDWRTTNAGASWSQVNSWGCPHGGLSVYYSSNKYVYAGGYQYPKRSTDNGITWVQLTSNMPYAYYYAVQGDGTRLYTMKSFADNGAKYNAPFMTSLESDGLTWGAYNPLGTGAQNFDNGPFGMRFDKTNRIVYAACWCYGLWALKVTGTATAASARSEATPARIAPPKNLVRLAGAGIAIRSLSRLFYDVKGRSIGEKAMAVR